MNLSIGIKYRISFVILYTLLSSGCFAQKKLAVKPGTSYARIIEASKQVFLPGIPEGTPTEKLTILLVWKSKDAPETFFWTGNGEWVNCIVEKAHHAHLKSPKYEFGETWYTTEQVTQLSKIKRGDTLELSPIYGGKHPVPAEVTADMTNRVFTKTAKSGGWIYLPVKKIIDRPKVAMP